MSSLLNDDQRQAIRDFEAAIHELLADVDDSCFDVESIEVCMDAVIEAWEFVKDLLTDLEDG